ncbi:hypothetical protein Acr_13g0011210 [Actinidia rufa]|uniref:Uncharacterized protein n=1 Tax=Actinidia rufa TaxID=165716 RepID=A0A7J0FLX0_9ERIC|nr:hypothetical protein Acr_13g0011210 [Actinidia rufa]
MGVVRKNFNVQATFCHLTSLGIVVGRCPSSKLYRVSSLSSGAEDHIAYFIAIARRKPPALASSMFNVSSLNSGAEDYQAYFIAIARRRPPTPSKASVQCVFTEL